MKQILRIGTLFSLIFSGYSLMAQSYQEKTTNASNVRLNVTNLGTFGNAFRGYRDGTGNPSAEYPAGSGVEHLFEGGIWIGGKENGGQIVVSTSAYDAPQGYAPGRGGFEFHVDTSITGNARNLQERSSLFDSRYFDPFAISHQDYVATFSDKSIVVPGTQIPINDHTRPMGVRVEMETYNWNYNFTDFMVIVNLRFYNEGQNTYDDVYTALWNNTVVRNVNITPAGAGGSAFYNRGGNGFMDSLHLAYCFDADGDPGFTESYVGQKFLGATDKEGFHHPDLDSNYNPINGAWELDQFLVNYNAWAFNDFSADFAFPTTENDRYQKMTQGLNQSPCWDNPNDPGCNGRNFQAELNASGNRSDLLAAGPFSSFAPGDVIEVSFAYVFAKKNEDGNPNTDNNEVQRANLITNAGWAQQAFNGEDQNFNGLLDPGEDNDGDGEITRFILPSPPNIPYTRVEPGDGQIEIYWSDNAERSIDPISNREDFEGYRLYLSKLGFDVTGVQDLARDFSLIAQYDKAGNNLFNETGFGSIKLAQPYYFEDDTIAYHYRYVIDNIPNGWQYATAVTAFDEGNPEGNLESLESSFLANNNRAFAGTGPNEDMGADAPFVYPNPYYYGAAWEGKSNFQEESRKIIFANLPARCVIRIYTAGGDFIDEIRHDENYDGSDTRWFRTFGAEDAGENRFSGGEHAWDLLSIESQIISRGLYMFSVEDLNSGEKFTGKFVIIK
ncbi:hypothetical protein [Croceimicrobium hydrocarbonivorans]|uniref:Uncharacterized protein n=1 Tax=Croceimicrobium hydrocarbonivorans TaxID=2761580 RepID=A0A7H0VI79_9FLAO|nr:hypothetical protein [Croceimicrobium hydrocarbonivorans]QNR25427.1 hypothetical protein H4K34_06195 [Croceimicrobium hydrocarbonivorans]